MISAVAVECPDFVKHKDRSIHVIREPQNTFGQLVTDLLVDPLCLLSAEQKAVGSSARSSGSS